MIKKYGKKWWKTLAVKIFAIYPESDLNTVLSLCVLITQSLPHSSIPDHVSLLLHWSQTLPLCFPLLYATASPAFIHNPAVALGKEGACADNPANDFSNIPPTICWYLRFHESNVILWLKANSFLLKWGPEQEH